MTRPDLSTDAGLKAYRDELRSVARPWRLGGFALVLAGALLASRGAWVQGWPHVAVNVGYGLLAIGWALLLAAIFLRTRHHRRRMAENA